MKHHIIQNIFKYVNHSNIEEEINFNISATFIDTPKLFNFNLFSETYTPSGHFNYKRYISDGNYQLHAQPDEDEDEDDNENEFESHFGLF